MTTSIPSAKEVRALLMRFSHAEMRALAKRADVPFTTLWKVRAGKTEDPRLETVRKLMPVAATILREAAEFAKTGAA
jgi:predicted transcriptional regulator